jgi:hypothetical protein
MLQFLFCFDRSTFFQNRLRLNELDAMGLVVRVPNRGAFVRELTAEEVVEILTDQLTPM